LLDQNGQQLAQVEALVRWVHPLRGFVSPIDFIRARPQDGVKSGGRRCGGPRCVDAAD
jgi:EAL domain-containing protein (putative c-di-GMP-specific phosphodiesterase class I)